MAVGKTQNILYICLVILGILGCAFLSSLFLTNTSVDDVYGWVHYYRFITSTLYIGVGNLIVNVVVSTNKSYWFLDILLFFT